MMRPAQMLAVALVYALGGVMARARGVTPEMGTLLWGLAALWPVAAGIHYANEYADAETDALTERTPFSGGSGAIPMLGVPRRLALRAAWAATILGSLVALAGLAAGTGTVFSLVILGLGALFGWMYSLPPLQLAWRGWGELDNALLGGFLLTLYGFSTAAGYVDFRVALAALPFTLLVFLNLLATTWADRRADAIVGKRTLATRWPPRRLRRLYLLVAGLSYALLLALPNVVLPSPVKSASLAALPFLFWGSLTYTRRRQPLPSVAAMAVMLLAQLVAWWYAGG
ncbi:MAG: prenyltransferase [Caldilineae bacterium]|nr:MAG: prenyltransferase [Caldilineae bacterium]